MSATPRPPAGRFLLWTAVCVLALPAAGRAQGLIGLARWEGTLEFGFDSDRQRTSEQTRSLRFERSRFDEKLGLRGWIPIFDPRLVTTNSSVTLGLLQDRLIFDGTETPIGGRLLGYDLGATILQEKPYTASLFASQTQGTISREFAGTSDVLTDNRGASLSLKQIALPSTFVYRKERLEEESRFGALIGKRSEFRNVFTYDARRNWTTRDLSVRYEFTTVDDRVVSALSHHAQTVGVHHRLDFGADGATSLISSLRYFNRQGRFSSASIGTDEGLVIQHSPSLSTGYHYSLFDYALEGSRTTTHVGLFSVQHRLYDSLKTDLGLRAALASLPSGHQQRWTGRVDPTYRKRLIGGGTLIAGLGGSYELQDDRFVADDILVFQERHTVRVGVPLRLTRPRVDPGSIVVTDESGTVVFQEGADYLVRPFGDFVEIDVLPVGRIRDGRTIAIDYRATVSPAIKFSTAVAHFNLGVDYTWIYPYVGYERAVQDLLSGADDTFLEDLTVRNAGVQLRWETAKFRGSLLNEYRQHDSRRLAFESLQFGQAISYLPSAALTLSLSLTEDLSDFRIPRRKTRSGLGRSTVGWRPPLPGLFVEGFMALRLWRDSVAFRETFSETGVKVTWSIGKIEMHSLFGYDVRTRDGSETRAFRVAVRAVRRLGGA